MYIKKKREKKDSRVCTILTSNDPTDHSEVIRISGDLYTFKSFTQSGHVGVQHNKKNSKSFTTQHFRFCRSINCWKVTQKSIGLEATWWKRSNLTPLKKEYKEIRHQFLSKLFKVMHKLQYKILLQWTCE